MITETKKDIIMRVIANGDKRSYNEIAADLELEIWTAKHKGWDYVFEKKRKK